MSAPVRSAGRLLALAAVAVLAIAAGCGQSSAPSAEERLEAVREAAARYGAEEAAGGPSAEAVEELVDAIGAHLLAGGSVADAAAVVEGEVEVALGRELPEGTVLRIFERLSEIPDS